MSYQSQSFLLAFLLLASGSSLASGYRVATAADAVPSPIQADTKFPELAQVINALQMFSPTLVAYIQDPKTVCTLIAPNDQAMTKTMNALGQYVGLVLSNKTMQDQILNYHVISGQKLKAEDMGTKVKSIETREGEPLYFVQHGDVPYVAFSKEYVQPIEVANIQAGGCIVHIVPNTLMAPPSLVPTLQDWLDKADNPDALKAPKNLWLTDSQLQSADTNAKPSAVDPPAALETLANSNAGDGTLQPESGTQQQAVTSGAEPVRTSLSLLAAVAVLVMVVMLHV